MRLSRPNPRIDVLARWCSCEMRHVGMWDHRKYHVSVCAWRWGNTPLLTPE